MISGIQTRNQRVTIMSVGALVFTVLFIGLAYYHLDSFDRPVRFTTQNNDTYHEQLLKTYVDEIYPPSIKPTDAHYKPFNSFEYSLPEDSEMRWKDSLGKKLCIIDLDSRGFQEPGQIFSKKPMSWAPGAPPVHGLSLGILNHWLYAKIHGYQYYYIEVGEYADRRDSWKKPSIMAELLKDHDSCLYLDSDAIFHHLDLPFEWLMNYWNIHKSNNSLALAFDPDLDKNKDKFGKLYLNTGFIIAQNNAKTFEIMNAWATCADGGGTHPECIKYRTNDPGRPTDQGGFGTFIRYDYAEDIKELPCTEANGFMESKTGCIGRFIKHIWTGKDTWLNIAVGQQVPGKYLELFHAQFLKEREQFFFTEEQLMAGETHTIFH